MAIDKVEKKTYEFSKGAILQLGLAAFLFVLAILLGWFAYANWSFKSSLVSGFEAFQRNPTPTEARNELTKAISWKPDHVGARQVLAKIACDAGGGELSNAEDQLKKIRGFGSDTADIKVAMGVVYLKKAELAKTEKEVRALVDLAAQEFSKAASTEGVIGLGHCDLLLAQKLNDRARLESAKKRFDGARKDLNSRAQISAGALIDYYSGLGTALAASDQEQDLKDARDAFAACALLARGWEVPRANLMTVEARRWMLWKGAAAEINASIDEVNQRRKVLGNYWKEHRDKSTAEKLARPWALWSIAFAQALARAGNERKSTEVLGEVKGISQLEAYPEAHLADASLHCEMALRPNLKPSEQDTLVGQALAPLDSLLRKHLSNPADDFGKDRKARALNAMAVMRFMQGPTQYKVAEDLLMEALKLFPDDYVYNRNLVMVLKRLKAPTAKYQAAFDKAKAGAAGPFADDFEKVQKVLEEK
jgi:hypothetical protein